MSLTIHYMGVANLTPDSFSDGNPHLDQKTSLEKLQRLSEWSNILDIGFESTGPMNQAILQEQELERFESQLKGILEQTQIELTGKTISLDTYRPQVFKEIYFIIKKFYPATSIIWNDISGVLDSKTMQLLESDLEFDYVLNHTEVKEKKDSNNHLNSICPVEEEKLIGHLDDFFLSQLKEIRKYTQRKVWFDPGFGFSKTREQNLYLIKNLDQLLSRSCYQNWLIGISRKSFLRPIDQSKQLLSKIDLHAYTEVRQSEWIKSFLQQVRDEKYNLIFRIHTPILKLVLDKFNQQSI